MRYFGMWSGDIQEVGSESLMFMTIFGTVLGKIACEIRVSLWFFIVHLLEVWHKHMKGLA